jgi:hypothetical protein
MIPVNKSKGFLTKQRDIHPDFRFLTANLKDVSLGSISLAINSLVKKDTLSRMPNNNKGFKIDPLTESGKLIIMLIQNSDKSKYRRICDCDGEHYLLDISNEGNVEESPGLILEKDIYDYYSERCENIYCSFLLLGCLARNAFDTPQKKWNRRKYLLLLNKRLTDHAVFGNSDIIGMILDFIG